MFDAELKFAFFVAALALSVVLFLVPNRKG